MLNLSTIMRKFFIIGLCVLGVIAPFAVKNAFAVSQEAILDPNALYEVQETYMCGEVTDITEEFENDIAGEKTPAQRVKIEITSGSEKGTNREIEHGVVTTIMEEEKVEVGDQLVIAKMQTYDGEEYYIVEQYRLPALMWLLVIFFVIAVLVGARRGLMAIIGLAASITILAFVVARPILDGKNPLLWSVVGAILITFVSLYIAHGFRKTTHVAAASTLLSLGLAVGLSSAAVALTHLFGIGSEEAFLLQNGIYGNINVHGLLLGGIMIGTLGVLDDVTTSQSAAIEQIHLADPTLSWKQLYRRGILVGREHIASLINTLVLAYAGASFALFVILMANAKPWWVVFNSEMIAEEVVRTLVGSTVLILSVPLVTLFAALIYKGYEPHGKSRTPDPPSADREETRQADGVLPFVACVARKCEQAHISLAILGNKRPKV